MAEPAEADAAASGVPDRELDGDAEVGGAGVSPGAAEVPGPAEEAVVGEGGTVAAWGTPWASPACDSAGCDPTARESTAASGAG